MNKIKSYVVSALVFSLLPLGAQASGSTGLGEQCLSGTQGNNHLLTQLAKVKTTSPISSALTKKYNLEPSATDPAGAVCAACQQGPGTEPLSTGNKATAEILRQAAPDARLLMRTECLNVSGKVDTSTSELKCPEGKLSAKHNFCFDSNLMRYQNAVITDFYKCIKKLTNLPLTPAGLFEMYSLESGFKPHYAYSGGVGVGQLTGIFVDDINQKHRGLSILKKVANTSDADCDIAKKIAEKDIKTPVRLNNNRCKFVEYGEGMERNVLYTMVGMANTWSKDLEPLLENYMKKNNGNPAMPRAMELALLNGYGPGGRAAARAAVRRLTKLSPTEFVNRMNKPMAGTKGGNLNSYIGKMQKRQKQLLTDMSPELRTEYTAQGARACINN
ncbi:hypothetical protein CIK05_09270 [Bdellovibrio sp. qaytius]|nr:hypothetical protein CIK05_09270 [Bdellovibrio sp. qaytius]